MSHLSKKKRSSLEVWENANKTLASKKILSHLFVIGNGISTKMYQIFGISYLSNMKTLN